MCKGKLLSAPFLRVSWLRWDQWHYFRSVKLSVGQANNIYHNLTLEFNSVYIDNPWMNARALAIKTGRVLGILLASRVFGARPVTLTGYSLGSLVIFEALRYLSTLPIPETMHLVEDVFLFGLPAPSQDLAAWRAVRRIVAGRLVNGYVGADEDYVLAILSRASSVTSGWGVAGLEPVAVQGVENVKCEGVQGHLEWVTKVGKSLELCHARGVDHTEVEEQLRNNVYPLEEQMQASQEVDKPDKDVPSTE